MQVFGDSSLKLYQPLVTVAALDYNTQQEFPCDVYVDGEYALTTSAETVDSFRVSPGVHNVTLSTGGVPHHYLINGSEVHDDNTLTHDFPYDTDVKVFYDTSNGIIFWPYIIICSIALAAVAVTAVLFTRMRRARKKASIK
jgi:hypothetical protein